MWLRKDYLTLPHGQQDSKLSMKHEVMCRNKFSLADEVSGGEQIPSCVDIPH